MSKTHNQHTGDDEESKDLMVAAFTSQSLPVASSVSVANVGASSKPSSSSSPRVVTFTSALPAVSSVSGVNVGASSKLSNSPSTVATITSSLPAASYVSVAIVGASGKPSVFPSSSTVATSISSLAAVSSVAGANVGTSGNEESEDVVDTGAEGVCTRIDYYKFKRERKKKERKKKVDIQFHQVIVFEIPWVLS